MNSESMKNLNSRRRSRLGFKIQFWAQVRPIKSHVRQENDSVFQATDESNYKKICQRGSC